MVTLQNRTDAELALLLQEGDTGAYTALYERYFPLLYTHVYKRLNDEELAKDIIQDFFAMLWEKKGVIHISSNLIGYFYTAVNHRIVDHFLQSQSRARHLDAFAGYLETTDESADHLLRHRQLQALIEQEIQALPSKMRRIFELSRKEQYSHKEIADELGISEKTVDRQISNALIRLRNKFGFVGISVILPEMLRHFL